MPSDADAARATRRVQALSAHVEGGAAAGASKGAPDPRVRLAPGGGPGSLTVVDNRTGSRYEVPVREGGYVSASAFKAIKAGGDGGGLRVFDPGYMNTAPCKSKICFIDGDKGVLRYRGYEIEELAEKSSYLETAFALIYGDLPDAPQLREWEQTIMRHSALPVPVIAALEALPHDAHPMGVILAGLNALSTFHPEQNPALQGGGVYQSHAQQDKQIVRIIGKMTTLAAHAYHRNTGRTPAPPNQKLGYAENFLYMLDAGLDPHHKPNPRLSRALDVMFLLHAEHEMNCSTAAARHLASSGVDVYSAVAGAVGALYGPLHGGANEAVLKMLARIGSAENIPSFLAGVKNKKEKMFGFGHRVYKNFDPRANVIRKVAEEVFELVGRDPLIDVAVALEKEARKDEYFVKRNLYPNVDFYSGLVYRALGFPPEFFTVLFAVPRAAGYLAHWRESLTDPDVKIMRPQQIYQGVWLRPYPSVDARAPCSGEDRMWNVAPSNASRRRLAGETVEMAASHYHGYDGGSDSPSGLANRLASVHLDAGQAQRLSSPAFSAGVVAGDATSGVDALTGVTGK
jgi:citrate synthase